MAPSLNTYGENAFDVCSKLTVINVPGGSIDEYCTGWSSYADKIKGFVTGNQISSGDFAGYWSTYYNNGCAVTVDEDTKIYYINAVNDNTATIAENTTDKVVTAGQAVVLKSSNANITMSYSADASGCAYTDNQLKGVDAETTLSSSDYASKKVYTLANESGLGFYLYYTSGYNKSIPANKAFLALDAAAGGRALLFSFEGEETGIADVRGNMEEGRGEYFDLQGRRVAQPTKGLYILNGKKLMVK